MTIDGIHHRIRESRLRLGLTQVALADRVGCSQSKISCWESRPGNHKLDTLRRLADALEIPPEWLVFGCRS